MTEPTIAQKAPCSIEVVAGETYFWCSCGKSANQPFCDGSHKDTDFKPMKFEPEASDTVYFCGCKKTQGPPMCDGTHKNL